MNRCDVQHAMKLPAHDEPVGNKREAHIMGVQVQRKQPEPQPLPIESISLTGANGRGIEVRPTNSGTVATSLLRTVVLSSQYGEECKWAATLGDLRSFGQALIDIADGK